MRCRRIRTRGGAAALAAIVALTALPAATTAAPAEQPVPPVPDTAPGSSDDIIAPELRDTMALGKAPASDDADDERIDVVIRLDDAPTADDRVALEETIGDLGRSSTIRSVPAISAQLTPEQIFRVAASRERFAVERIELDEVVTGANEGATIAAGADQVAVDFGITGSGVTVAVLDTGIDVSHPDLDGGKVVGFYDAIDERETFAFDDSTSSHGTHIAGVIAGDGHINPALAGVAPGARLVGVKVLDANTQGFASDIATGIDWVLDNRFRFGIEIVNVSIEGRACTDGRDVASAAINQAAALGILVVVSAGNKGPGRCTVTLPGSATGALTVGSVRDPSEGGYRLEASSSRGPTAVGVTKPDIVAPGYNITSTIRGSGYAPKSGTSMSAPVVAGVAALVSQADPALTGVGIRTVLVDTATDVGRGSLATLECTSGRDVEYGHGVLHGYAAVAAARGFGFGGPARPDHRYFDGSLTGTGDADFHRIRVDSLAFPISVTMVQPNTGSGTVTSVRPNLALFDPNGLSIPGTIDLTRSEGFHYWPPITGTYTVVARSDGGAVDYYLDVFGGLAGGPAPGRPADFDIDDTAKVLRLSWASPPVEGAGPITSYRVTTRPDGRARVGSGCATDVTIQRRGTTSVEIRALNQEGISPPVRKVLRQPFGRLGAVQPLGGAVRVRGWTIDPGTSGAVQVDVLVDGRVVASDDADLRRAGLATSHPGFGVDHGYDMVFDATPGSRRITVIARDAQGNADNDRVLGRRTIEVPRPPRRPYGAAKITSSEGSVVATGFAVDPNTDDPITVRLIIDDKLVAETVADRNRPSLPTMYPGVGPLHGYKLTAPAPPGEHDVRVVALNASGTPGVSTTLIDARLLVGPPVRNPFGQASLATAKNAIVATGWAADPNTDDPVTVRTLVDGKIVGNVVADRNRPNLPSTYPGLGPRHGFSSTTPLAPGTYAVEVVALNHPGGPGRATTLLEATITVPIPAHGPFGSATVAITGGTVTATGFAVDPDTDDPISVRLVVDDVIVAVAPADRNRPNLPATYPGVGPLHGFRLEAPVSPGPHEIRVLAVNRPGTPGTNTRLYV